MSFKGKVWIGMNNNGDGSASALFFSSLEDADKWEANNAATTYFEGFCDAVEGPHEFEFDDKGVLLNPDSFEVDEETDIHKEAVKPPSLEEIHEEDVTECVHEEIDNSWRHGSYMSQVHHRKSDDTYWSVNFQVSGDGEYNTLREGECEKPEQVFPHKETKIIVTYTSKEK